MEILSKDTPNSFIFDFDSTIVSIETLDTIIKNKLDDEEIKQKIDDITKKSMNGELDFNTSITTRISSAQLNANDFKKMASEINNHIIPQIPEIITYLIEKEQNVFIISGGFIEIIKPTADKLGIPFTNCFANDIVVDENDNVTGILDTPLAYEKGKNAIVKQLRLQSALTGKVVMIGDGMSDFDVYGKGDADIFIGCGFIETRQNVKDKAPYFAKTTQSLLDIITGFFN